MLNSLLRHVKTVTWLTKTSKVTVNHSYNTTEERNLLIFEKLKLENFSENCEKPCRFCLFILLAVDSVLLRGSPMRFSAVVFPAELRCVRARAFLNFVSRESNNISWVRSSDGRRLFRIFRLFWNVVVWSKSLLKLVKKCVSWKTLNKELKWWCWCLDISSRSSSGQKEIDVFNWLGKTS